MIGFLIKLRKTSFCYRLVGYPSMKLGSLISHGETFWEPKSRN